MPAINNLLAQFYILKGDKAKAEELYGKSFMEGQISSLGYGLVGYANFWINQNSNLDSAVAMAEIALKLQPDNSYFLSQAAGVYIKAGKDDKAIAIYGPAFMQKNIGDATVLNSYAWFWAGQGKNLNNALAAAKKAVELQPGRYAIWDTLGAVYAKMKNTAEAIKAQEKAIELAPDSLKEAYKKNLEKIKSEAAKK